MFKSKAKFQFVGGQKQARIHCFTGFPPAIVEQPSWGFRLFLNLFHLFGLLHFPSWRISIWKNIIFHLWPDRFARYQSSVVYINYYILYYYIIYYIMYIFIPTSLIYLFKLINHRHSQRKLKKKRFVSKVTISFVSQ